MFFVCWHHQVSGEYSLLLNLEEQRRQFCFSGCETGGWVGGKIGSEHKEDVNEICGWVCRRKEAGNPKKEAPFLL